MREFERWWWDDLFELMHFFVQKHLRLPVDWPADPEFTFLEETGQVQRLLLIIPQIQERLEQVHWKNLQQDPLLQEWACEALNLLDWPADFPEVPDEGYSRSNDYTLVFRFKLLFLALSAEEKRRFVPFRFDGTQVLDNGLLVRVEDPMALFQAWIADHFLLDGFEWWTDPEFTAVQVDADTERFETLIDEIGQQAARLSWQEFIRDEALRNRAIAALNMLQWPIVPPVGDVQELLDNYTYGGFSEVAIPVPGAEL